MKKIIISGAIALTNILASQILQAQGTITYLSNLGQSFANSNPVGNDSWLAAGFITGNNVGGYELNSIQLAMADALGSPSGFAVMVYSSGGLTGIFPESSLGTLNGSDNPSTTGIYTYTPASTLTLSPSTDYFIVLTAGTTAATDAYEWNYTSANSYNSSDNWLGVVTSASNNNGSSWIRLGSNPQYDFSAFAIDATAVPEPSSLALFSLVGAALLWRRQAKTVR